MTWHLSCHTTLPSAHYGPAIMTSFLSPGPKFTSGTMLVVPLSLSTLARIIKQLDSSYHSNLNSNVFSPERSFLSIQSKREFLIPSTSLYYHMTLFIFLLVPFIMWNYVVYISYLIVSCLSPLRCKLPEDSIVFKFASISPLLTTWHIVNFHLIFVESLQLFALALALFPYAFDPTLLN